MGEANNRGSRDSRVAESIRKAASGRLPAIACNACQTRLSDIDELDVAQLPGIHVAYQAHCAACDQDTWAVRGDAPAVRAFYEALEKAAGQKVQLGTAKPPADD